MRLIGLSGKKQAGKSTAAEYLCDIFSKREDTLVYEVSFASFLKKVVARCFYSTDVMRRELYEVVVNEHTGREWLQIVGTEWFREANSECWVNAARSEIDRYVSEAEVLHLKLAIIISDVRFPNELEIIKEYGGTSVRFLRNPYPEDQHVSETALDQVVARSIKGKYEDGPTFDHIINNIKTPIEDKNRALLAILEEE